MADKHVKIRDDNDIVINPASEESIDNLIDELQTTIVKLNQLIAKIPVGLTVDSAGRFRAVLDTASNIINNEYWVSSAASMLNIFTGLNQTRQAWQQQRQFLNL